MVGCHSFQMALLLVIFFIIIFLFVTFHCFEHHQQNSVRFARNHERFDSITGVNLYQMQQIHFRFCEGQSVGC